MTVLVTGAGGFLGSALVRRILATGPERVRCLVRSRSSEDSLLASLPAESRGRAEIVVGDLLAPGTLAPAVEGVACVYHLASGMGGSVADLTLNSVVGTRNLLDAMAAGAAGLVLVSSFSVYGTSSLPPHGLVDEFSPLEPNPEKRDPYAFAKLRQERLCREYAERTGLRLTVLRPGVVYGPEGRALSPRVGLDLFGLFLHLGRRNRLPLTFVENCADAIAAAGRSEQSWGNAYNVVDDDLPTSAEFLRRYRRGVERIRYVTVPYPLLMALSRMVSWYHRRSRGQLPDIFTPYKTRAMWKPQRYSNEALKRLGWHPRISTADGMARTFEWLRNTRN